MKRLYIGIILVVVLSTIITCGKIQVTRFCKKMSNIFTEMRLAVNEDDVSKAITLTKKAELEWVESEKTMGLFVNRSDLNGVGITVCCLTSLIENDEKAEYLSELNKAKVQLEHIRKLEEITSS